MEEKKPNKFIPPPFALNNIDRDKSAARYNDNAKPNILGEAKKLVSKNYEPNILANAGQMNAVVLEVRDPGDPSLIAWKDPLLTHAFYGKKSVPDVIEVRYRIPELHAYIPEPESPTDWARINLHPIAIMKKEKGMPTVGDIIRLDFTDKNNFSGAIVVETLNTNNNPNAGGNCSPLDTFNTAAPNLNLTQPTGDSQDSEKTDYSATNDPASESFIDGIEYEIPLALREAYESLKSNLYIISLREYIKLEDFKNLDAVVNTLASKNVFSVCFTISEEGRLLRDIKRFKSLTTRLAKHGIYTSILIHESLDAVNPALLHAAAILKEAPCVGIYWRIPEKAKAAGGTYGARVAKVDQVFRNLANSRKIKYGAIFTEESSDIHALPSQQDVTYLADNYYDYLKRSKTTPFNGASSYTDEYPDAMPLYFLGGINLLYSPAEPCINGVRTKEVLDAEIESGHPGYAFVNYGFFTFELSGLVSQKTAIDPTQPEKQNLLNSVSKLVIPQKANVEDITGFLSTPQLPPPTFNSDDPNTQTPAAVPPVPMAAAPGASCSTMPGAEGFGNPPPPASVVNPPSFRFDSIENYQNLGWTANKGALLNDVIYDFMQRFSAAVYRRVPPTHPAIAGSIHKKIRLTSTYRTTEKQVQLMWDKIKNGGGNQAVYGLYGDPRWVVEVVEAYHQNNFERANNAVKQRLIDTNGGSGHGSGKAVDVHTWSHLQAEGIEPHGSASKKLMKTSLFVQAIIAACAECNAKPVVEAYQQHVHITIR